MEELEWLGPGQSGAPWPKVHLVTLEGFRALFNWRFLAAEGPCQISLTNHLPAHCFLFFGWKGSQWHESCRSDCQHFGKNVQWPAGKWLGKLRHWFRMTQQDMDKGSWDMCVCVRGWWCKERKWCVHRKCGLILVIPCSSFIKMYSSWKKIIY